MAAAKATMAEGVGPQATERAWEPSRWGGETMNFKEGSLIN